MTINDNIMTILIHFIRSGDGLHPKYLKEIIGKMPKDDLRKGTPLNWQHIEK